MTTLTISLPDSLKEFIEREVETKGYGNVSEYVRGLLRKEQANETDAKLEALLIEGLTKGKDISVLLISGANSGETPRKFLRGRNSLGRPGPVRARSRDRVPSGWSTMKPMRF